MQSTVKQFPDSLKVDIKSMFKSNSRNVKENYQPVSILLTLCKVFERYLQKQCNVYFENTLSNYQCGFRKSYTAQQCLISMIGKLQDTLDKGGISAALLTYI